MEKWITVRVDKISFTAKLINTFNLFLLVDGHKLDVQVIPGGIRVTEIGSADKSFQVKEFVSFLFDVPSFLEKVVGHLGGDQFVVIHVDLGENVQLLQ